MRRLGLVAAAVCAAACAGAAPRRPAVPMTPAVSEAEAERARLERRMALGDARVLDGCYDCLVAARAAYAEAAANAALHPLVVQRLFETSLLVAVRERELGIDSRASFASAAALAADPAVAPDATVLVAVADAIAPDVVGMSNVEADAYDASHPDPHAKLPAWRAAFDAGPASPARTYLRMALDCTYAPAAEAPDAAAAPADRTPPLAPGAPPLVMFRAAMCGMTPGLFEAVRARVPEFVETEYFLGRLALIDVETRGPAKAFALLSDAHAHFPTSASMAYSVGALQLLIEDYDGALPSFDAVLRLSPLHDGAWLGRLEALTSSGRYDTAVAEATRALDLRVQVGRAYYWRARAWYGLHDLEHARADIDQAKARDRQPDTLTMAGIIEYDQHDLEIARTDLVEVRVHDALNQYCVARYYLGFVEEGRKQPADAAGAFAEAASCYEHAVAVNQDLRDATTANAELDAAYRQARLAKLDRLIVEARDQESASAYNAAVNYLRGGDKDKATTFADMAARDPARHDVVEELRKLIIRRGRAA